WIDALINYISGIDFLKSKDKFDKLWPPDVQLIGKDILWFHVVIWPALLLSAGLELPKTIFAHGFLTVDGKKISKSLGTEIDPMDLVEKYGSDAVRYYLCRAIPFGEDGDFSEKNLRIYYNNELLNEVGNLAYRILSLAERYFGGVLPEISGHTDVESEVSSQIANHLSRFHRYMQDLQIHHAVMEVIKIAQRINVYLNKTEPWKLWKQDKKERVKVIIRHAVDWLYVLDAVMYPFMPKTALNIAKQLGLIEVPSLENIKIWGNLAPGHKLGKKEILFKKLEDIEK
ncbi:MAG: methionine--tRNA ligase, partial [Candidatus Njordarchaeota archaeon]